MEWFWTWGWALGIGVLGWISFGFQVRLTKQAVANTNEAIALLSTPPRRLYARLVSDAAEHIDPLYSLTDAKRKAKALEWLQGTVAVAVVHLDDCDASKSRIEMEEDEDEEVFRPVRGPKVP